MQIYKIEISFRNEPRGKFHWPLVTLVVTRQMLTHHSWQMLNSFKSLVLFQLNCVSAVMKVLIILWLTVPPDTNHERQKDPVNATKSSKVHLLWSWGRRRWSAPVFYTWPVNINGKMNKCSVCRINQLYWKNRWTLEYLSPSYRTSTAFMWIGSNTWAWRKILRRR